MCLMSGVFGRVEDCKNGWVAGWLDGKVGSMGSK